MAVNKADEQSSLQTLKPKQRAERFQIGLFNCEELQIQVIIQVKDNKVTGNTGHCTLWIALATLAKLC